MFHRCSFFTALWLCCVLQSSAQSTYSLPYNPDANADSAIGAPDLLEFLPLFGNTFTPAEVMVDGQTLTEYIAILEEAAANSSVTDTVTIPMMPGTTPGEMLYWDGTQWSLVPTGEPGDALLLEGSTPTWRAQRLGCTDQTACNYELESTVLDPSACIYEDACGICGGPGAIQECGCGPLPPGDCDCDGNQLDALNVCGGTCLEDVDGDGICDDDGNDDCIGVVDACGICNGPGAIYDCGCTGIAPDACDCEGSPDEDQDGICDSVDPCVAVPDSDGDGICDDVDDCFGDYDSCGICNGPGPIYECGCSDIPEGDCDCAGNVPDSLGVCQDYAADTDGDGLYDMLTQFCQNQTSLNYGGHEYGLVSVAGHCWFQENLRVVEYRNGDEIPLLVGNDVWGSTSSGAYCRYSDSDSLALIYGHLYNWYATTDERQLCPEGWRIPGQSDWTSLADSLGGIAVAGGWLKESGNVHWEAPNVGATNLTGFTAIPGGERGYASAGFVGLGTEAHLWTVDGAPNNGGLSAKMLHDNESLSLLAASRNRGKSIRCIQNDPVFGCTDVNFLEFNPLATVNDGGCLTPSIPGCTNPNFVVYDPAANVDDGSCGEALVGCADSLIVSYQGYDYETVAVGDQCWFAENLRATEYQNGEPILLSEDPVEWSNLTVGGYCAKDLDEANAALYGYLYNAYAANDLREICPVGWRLPTPWDIYGLQENVDNLVAGQFLGDGSPELSATALKASVLDSPGWDGTNSTGFTGLPGGRRSYNGSFSGNGYWWSQSGGMQLSGGNVNLGVSNYQNMQEGKSIRCIQVREGCNDPSASNYSPFVVNSIPEACCYGETVLLNMFDSFGDGWNGSTWTLSLSSGVAIFSTTLSGGSFGTATICGSYLPGDYTITVTAGVFPSEVSWSVEIGGIPLSGGVGTYGFTID